MLTVLDLFSGIGGFSLGLERTRGFKTIGFCEIDPYCRAVLAKHWPGIPCHDDIRTLTVEPGHADVLCGGFPCQDISIAGKGAGLAGERSGLWREYHRLIRMVHPRYVIIENVSALLNRGMGDILGELSQIGYDAEWHCIQASYVGLPHIRDRIWIVAYPGQKLEHELQYSSKSQQSSGIEGRQTQVEIGSELGLARRKIEERWAYQPAISGMDDGIPADVDALGALGNAIVPQIAEMIGNAILEMEHAPR